MSWGNSPHPPSSPPMRGSCAEAVGSLCALSALGAAPLGTQ